MPDSPVSAQGRLADRLRASRARGFVGRGEHLAEFRAALDGEPGAYAVCFVHGPGGVGKSSLLRRFKDTADDAGRTVIEIDGRTLEPSLNEFFAAAETAHVDDRAVVLIDTFEKCEGLEDWLRECFLPRVRTGVVVVVAGRKPPAVRWSSDVDWAGTLRVVQLDGLTPAESDALLDARGVKPELRETVAAFAGGNPLALSLVADAATRIGAVGTEWKPTQDVIAPLVSQLLGDVPSETHRVALTVLAQSRVTSEGLLQTVMSESDAARMFDWLIQQPYVELGQHGAYPHDVVREVLEADLRWRNQERYAEVYNRIWPYLLRVGRLASGSDVLPAMHDILYLLMREVEDDYLYKMQYEGRVYEAPLAQADRPDVMALATQATGPVFARILDFWLERQPGGVRLYRSSESGSLAACMIWVRIRDGDREALERDPVAAAAWAHATEAGVLRPHEHIGIGRYLVHPAAYQVVSAPMHLMQLRTVAEWVRAEGLTSSYFVTSNPDYWRQLLDHLQHWPVPQRPQIAGVEFSLFGRDWERAPLERWFEDRHGAAPIPAPSSPAVTKLSRTDFDLAVRQALGSWRSSAELAANPLARTKLVRKSVGGQPVGEAEIVTALRDVVGAAVDALREDPRTVKMYQAVAATYRDGSPTQQAAARRLKLPFSTYRRHLTRGIERVCETLWERELKPH